ncbi:hypothetical protein TCE0_047f17760 [Talaromyces pinophilus]|uniref:Xaa-Pro dipeptidyl-peptidase-like domain-containing protein n=1 Tax=Talaromyces pinophilus TaxID=128442 RepID=A0A0B8MYY2_TALPI|nr:hypothetical protein TCE0_047f17760 [Talaromyces pinophilus]
MTSTTIGGIEVLFGEAHRDFTKRWLRFGPSMEILQPVQMNKLVPAILAWSPYGKQGNVPRDATSDLEKSTALDPAEWCPRGYAIVNVDSRGIYDADGDMFFLGTQPWCNGAVAVAGNSYLAAAQWFIAAERPPHLKAIAPWEGFADFYREFNGGGGIPNYAFVDYCASGYRGNNRQEDTGAMIRKYSLWNAYWDDKSVKFAQIDVPIHALASFSTMLRTEGTIRMSSNDELQKFFDRYLYGKTNDWESTAKVRHGLLGFNCECIVNEPEPVYPPSYVEHRTFFLDSQTATMSECGASSKPSSTSYVSDSWDDDGAHFVHTFSKYYRVD